MMLSMTSTAVQRAEHDVNRLPSQGGKQYASLSASSTASFEEANPTAEAGFGRICAVIVTYNIGSDFTENFESLIHQTDHAVVIDNGSGPETLAMLEALNAKHRGFMTLVHNSENNLAKAQNIGIRKAREGGFKWVLLLDHDSRLDHDMIGHMRAAYHDAQEREQIGILAPHIKDRNAPREHGYLKSLLILGFFRAYFNGKPVIDRVMSVISSGSLIPLDVFEATGMMDEKFIIDYLDNDFCLRLITRGYRIMVVRDALLYHSLGECREHQVLGLHVTSTNHSPLRRYYIYRNRLTTWRRYAFSVPAFVVYDVLASLYDMLRILLFEGQKLAKFRMIGRGMWHALCGRLGGKLA